MSPSHIALLTFGMAAASMMVAACSYHTTTEEAPAPAPATIVVPSADTAPTVIQTPIIHNTAH